ncbi:hypothetical protein RHMOL_Rhmol04G0066600 [Rhododendron molle]|uniref:Uncharacterized protein n=1 Tax=Rhododendron molle TaxID=49168 RepID=A0ACC0P087_RHOML|nr:hypothetical protein RHMOL_Rhmol04G0066600 [Rhododendron molle]
MIKINVDAAVSKEAKTIGTGAIAWGNDGVVLGIMLTVREGIISSRIAEAVAIRDGLNIGIALNHTKVIIEPDAESIVRSCATPKDSASDVAVLVKLSGEGSWLSKHLV